MIKESKGFAISGYIVAPVLIIAHILWVSVFANSLATLVTLEIATFLLWIGFFMVQPNQGKVLTLFGHYVGTVKSTGLQWTVPFYLKKRISLRIRNFESAKIKVNDNQGNPIEIATVVVWSVTDTAEAMFEVDDYESYVTIQSESALRMLASSFPYDPRDDQEAELALRSHPAEIANKLVQHIQERLGKAGITIHEARISHLAYAQEIAGAMLQRQQAAAIIAARSRIVDGAVGMVQMALEKLKDDGIVELDEERKIAMVSNLMVVLCGDKSSQPVINAGTLY